MATFLRNDVCKLKIKKLIEFKKFFKITYIIDD